MVGDKNLKCMEKVKLTPRQREIVKKMQDGWRLIIIRSDSTGSLIQYVSKGFENDFFNSTVFSALLSKGIIYQGYERPFEYILTKTGESI